MAGKPWERYGGASKPALAGPWTKYADPNAVQVQQGGSGPSLSGLSTDQIMSAGRTPVDYGDGLAANVLQGFTANSGDEMAGAARVPLSASPGMLMTNPLALGLGMLGQDKMLDAASGGAYSQARGNVNELTNRFAEDHPTAAIAGQIVGSLPTMMAAPAGRALTWGGNVARGAAIGGGYGAIAGYNAGDGSVTDRLASGAIGAGIGGAGGGAVEFFAPTIGRWFGIPSLTPSRDPAAIRTMADSLPAPVPMTAGQMTDNVGQLGREFNMMRLGEGNSAATIMRDFSAKQQDALLANRDLLQQQIANGGPVIERGAGGEMASKRLAAMDDAAHKSASGLYDEAQRLTPPTAMADRPFGNPDTVGAKDQLYGGRRSDNPDPNFGTTPRADFPERIGQRMMADAWDALVKTDPTTKNAGAVSNLLTMYGKAADKGPLGVADVEQLRRGLTAIQKGAPSADTAAAFEAKKVLDHRIEDAINRNLLDGDTQALEAWKKATNGWRDYRGKFGSNDLVGELVAKDGGQGGALKVKPEEAANYILGKGALDYSAKDLSSGLTKLRDVLGPDSPEWNAIRQEAFIRIASAAKGKSTPTGNLFSGANLATAWNDFTAEAPAVAKTLFSTDERKAIGNWVAVAKRVTVPDPAVYAPSTPVFSMRRLINLAGKLPSMLPVAGKYLAGLDTMAADAASATLARKATSGAIPAGVYQGVQSGVIPLTQPAQNLRPSR